MLTFKGAGDMEPDLPDGESAHLVQPGVVGVVETHAFKHAVWPIGYQLLHRLCGLLLPEIDNFCARCHLRGELIIREKTNQTQGLQCA